MKNNFFFLLILKIFSYSLSGLAAGSAAALTLGPDAILHALDAIKSVPVVYQLTKAAVAFPIVYHYLGEVRHLYWDSTAKGLNLKQVQNSSRILIAAAAVLTLYYALA